MSLRRCTRSSQPHSTRHSTRSPRSNVPPGRTADRRATWPMLILRTPKGWTGPKEIDGLPVEGTWRSHQVPIARRPRESRARPPARGMAALLPAGGALRRARVTRPGARRARARGRAAHEREPARERRPLLRDLVLPDFRDYAVEVEKPATTFSEATRVLGEFLRDVIVRNPENFRIFGPDETASNRLGDVFEVDRPGLGGGARADRRGSRSGRAGRRGALRASLPGLARGLPADGPARALQLLRGVHPHRRLDVQPAREVAEGDARTSRGAARSPRSTTCSARMSGARITTASRTRIRASSTTS